jgi:hypothetical protein
MPDSRQEMEGLEKLLDFDWDQYKLDESDPDADEPKMITCPHCGEQFEQ